MKKLICVILALSMFGSGVVFANESADNNSDMSFMKAFGFLSDAAVSTDALTRLDLAKIYYSIVSGSSAPAIGVSKFSDVSQSDAGVVNFVADMKIMVGDGNGLFSPDDRVTFAQLAKTIVSFLGYDEYALQNGGYPFGYIIQAERLGLIQSYPQSEDDIVTFALAASVFKLASDVRMVYELNDALYTDANYLKKFKGIDTLDGVVASDNVTDISGSSDLYGYDEILVGNKLFKLTDSAFTLKNYVGYSVRIYYDKNDNVVWFEADDNRVKKISGKDTAAIERRGAYITVSYHDGKSDSELKLNNGITLIYNGTVCESYGDSIFNIVNDEKYTTSIEAVDNDFDGSYDVLFIDAYRSYIVKAVVAETIYTKSEDIISLGDFTEGDIPIVNISGKYIPLDSIAENDIVNVFADENGKVNKIAVTIDTFSGRVEEVSKEDGIIVIDGNKFNLSPSAKFCEDADKLRPGAEIKAYFNYNGEICVFELSDKIGYMFGYLMDAKDTSKSLDDTYSFKIFSETGLMTEARLADKVTVNGDSKLDAEDAYALAGFTDGEVNRQIIIYKINKQTGEITSIRYCSTNGPEDGLYMYEGFDGLSSRKDLPYKLSAMTFGAKLLVSSGTVVFAVPGEEERDDEDSYSIKTVSIFKNDDTSTLFEAYGTEEESPIADALVVKQKFNKSEDLDDNMILVDRISMKTNEKDDTVLVVRGISNGAEGEFVFEEDAISDIEKGDVIFPFGQSSGGIWSGARLVFDKDKNAINGSNPTGNYISDIRFCYGRVIAKGEDYISVEIENALGEISVEHYNTSKFKLAEFNFSHKDGEASVADALRIFDAGHYGDSASRVLVHTRRGDAKSIVIYNEI